MQAEHAQHASGEGDSPLSRAASYNAALCSESESDWTDARDRYRALAQNAQNSPNASNGTIAKEGTDSLDANLRRARLDVELEDFADLDAATPSLLVHTDLAPPDRAEVLALQALGLIHRSELSAAETVVDTALRLLGHDEDSPPPQQNAAAVHFARGEVLRARGLAITFVPMPSDIARKIELRCQKVLDAEDAYIETIKTKQVRWAVRGGYRVASMYIALHDDLLAIPPPKGADTDARKQLFRGAMRLRYRVLIEKGLGTLEHTLNLETSPSTSNVSTSIYAKAREAKAQLERQLAEEKKEIAKLPYSEADLQKAFDELASKP
ncbi:MAG: hypothetical protein NVS3B20_03840 [Polyangiales bacterium]